MLRAHRSLAAKLPAFLFGGSHSHKYDWRDDKHHNPYKNIDMR